MSTNECSSPETNQLRPTFPDKSRSVFRYASVFLDIIWPQYFNPDHYHSSLGSHGVAAFNCDYCIELTYLIYYPTVRSLQLLVDTSYHHSFHNEPTLTYTTSTTTTTTITPLVVFTSEILSTTHCRGHKLTWLIYYPPLR